MWNIETVMSQDDPDIGHCHLVFQTPVSIYWDILKKEFQTGDKYLNTDWLEFHKLIFLYFDYYYWDRSPIRTTGFNNLN